MDQTAQSQADNATLIERISYPLFFQKMAGYGYGPNSEKAAQDLANLAQMVVPAVDRFVNRELAAVKSARDASVSGALAATMDVAGIAQPVEPAAAPAGFMADPAIKAAAERLTAEQFKAAGLVDMIGPGKSKEEEDEEEAKKKMEAPPG